MESTDYTHLSWDAFQHARSLALRRMRPDGGPADPGPALAPPPAVARVVATAVPDSGEPVDARSSHD